MGEQFRPESHTTEPCKPVGRKCSTYPLFRKSPKARKKELVDQQTIGRWHPGTEHFSPGAWPKNSGILLLLLTVQFTGVMVHKKPATEQDTHWQGEETAQEDKMRLE